MKVAFLTTDNREHFKDYSAPVPYFGTAPEAVLCGMEKIDELEVHVISCTREKMTSPSRLAPNIHFHSLHVPRLGWLKTGYQGCIRATRRLLRELKPDIAHGQGTERDCALNALFSGCPNVVTIHGNVKQLGRLLGARPGSFFWAASLLEDYTLKRTAGVFCNSSHTERLVAPRARKTWRVPNPVREEFFAPLPSSGPKNARPRLLNIGVISPYKCQLELLELARALRRKGPDFELRFIGYALNDDDYTRAFLRELKKEEPERWVIHIPQKNAVELRKELDETSALIHFPLEESFGLVVAEALARNVKVFAARVGGLVDIAADVPGAELFQLGNWPRVQAAIEGWMRQGCQPPSGAAAIMRARYDAEVIARQHAWIYGEVLQASA